MSSRLDIDPDRLTDNPYQPRIDYNPLAKLARSIEEDGVLEPPTVRVVYEDEPQKVEGISTEALPDDAEIQIADGHRRVRATRKAGLDTVTVRVRHLTDEQMARLAAITAGHRESLTPIEQARHARVLQDEFDHTQEEIAEAFGRSRSWVSRRLGLLELPEFVRANIQSGDLATRQAQAIRPVFEADLSDVTFPEDNHFAPEKIINRALDGKSSNDLRKDVKQFESWVRQLRGQRQEEVREQEYEKDLESNQQTDGSGPDRRDVREDDSDASPSASRTTSPLSEDHDTGGQRPRTVSSPEENVEGTSSDVHELQRRASARQEEIGGDGAPTKVDEEIENIIDEVAQQIGDKIDQSVSTRHLIALGLGSPNELHKQVRDRLWAMYDREGSVKTARDVRAMLDDWLDEVGYLEVDVHPGTADIGSVVPDQVDDLLGMQNRHWEREIADRATIPSLLVAHRVAGENGRTWLSASITEVVRDRVGSVTEKEIPDRVMDQVQEEVGRRLETVATYE